MLWTEFFYFLFVMQETEKPSFSSPGDTQMRIARVCTVIVILVGGAFSQTKSAIQSERERELRRDLSTIRDAIHRYKAAADRGAFQIRVGSEGYPPNLEMLVTGVETDSGTKLKFLDRIPADPITRQEWGLRSTKKTNLSGVQNVSDVYCKSDQVASDGTKYKDW
jgi:general secretion pathway protein G